LCGSCVAFDAGFSSGVFDAIDRKLEEVEWLLNYARNANKRIPVASAITTNKVSAPRRLMPRRLLNPATHHQTTESAHLPIHHLLDGTVTKFESGSVIRSGVSALDQTGRIRVGSINF
jgi:hypothetical protein